MKTGKIANILDELQSHIVSLYPTNLQNLLNHPGFNGLQEHSYLCVVHSEISTKAQRNGWSDKLGFPVFDEYSSEELTRIALELPCGHYHVHDDSVYAEILDEATNEVASSGETGLFVGTNLMNEAMPFIRYVQGDHCMKESDDSECDCGWSRLGPIQGRENDSFITIDGRLIPAGTLLDLTYRWMFDSGINPKGFEFIQKTRDRVIVNIWPILDESSTKKISEYIRAYVKVLIGNNCTVEVNTLNSRPDRNGKFRPIRREFTIN
jgi:phenylacetate-CoA ligase